MQAYGLEPQVVLTTPLIDSWDGAKMSGSRGNYIALVEAPDEQFGKTMRLPDELLADYYRLVMEQELDPGAEPMEAKLALARFIVERSHGPDAAARAEEHFTRVVREHQAPADVPDVPLPAGEPEHLPAPPVENLWDASSSEGRRLIAQGGVRLDGAAVAELDLPRDRLEGAVI